MKIAFYMAIVNQIEANFAQPTQEHGAGLRVLGLAVVQSDLYTTAKFDVLHPVVSISALFLPAISMSHCQSC